MSTILNAAPRSILQGVKDESGGILPVVPELIPSHLPHVFLFAEKGPEEPQLVSGGSMTRMFGAKTFDLRSEYANHQTVLANEINGQGNAMIVQRLKPADAGPEATLRLSLEIVETELPVYQREADGSLSRDVDGNPIDTGAEPVTGYKARWLLENVASGVLGEAMSATGALMGTGAADSTIYPIMELKVSSFGKHGNRKGIRLWAPTARTVATPANEDLILDQNAFMYRIQMIERPDEKSNPYVIETESGSQSVEFSFKEGAINTKVDQEMFIESILLDAYRDLDVQPRQYGPFNELHVYHGNIETVLDMVFATEQPHHPTWPMTAEEGRHMINFVSGQDIMGHMYHTLSIVGSGEGGIELTPVSNHYASGGSDGTMTFESHDLLVRHQCENYGDLDYNFMDMAYWPQSIVYDTGFSLDTKKSLMVPVGRRKDMMAVISTQDVSAPQNTAEQESSIAIALRAAARLYPESEVFGTSVCRIVIVGHSGKLLNSPYKGLLPLTIEFASKCANFMGAGSGIWASDRGFDTAPYNQITMFKDVNCTFKSQNVYDKDWNAGLVWVQNFDRRSLFFPAVQTVYDDATSVLNSAINAFIVTEIEKVAHRAWTQLTGSSKLTKDQFVERSNELIETMTNGRFDGRVIVQPRTYFTGADEALGYSWSCDITLFMNNMMTVGTYTVVSRRTSDFLG